MEPDINKAMDFLEATALRRERNYAVLQAAARLMAIVAPEGFLVMTRSEAIGEALALLSEIESRTEGT